MALPLEAIPPAGAQDPELEQLEIELLLEAVYRRYGFDFRQYAQASLKRRLWRRLIAEGLHTITDLQAKLLHDPIVELKERSEPGTERTHARLLAELLGIDLDVEP